jgi:hypothetical protein
VWPASFALSRAYVDQLARSKGLGATRVAAVRESLSHAEGASGGARRDALTQLAAQLDGDAAVGGDSAKIRTLAASVRDLAGTTH